MAETVLRLAEVDAVFQRLPDHPEAGIVWDRLVTQYQVVGVSVHDAQLVASMIVNGIDSIPTLNMSHFRRYREITALHPRDVARPLTG